jgi:hypothetical protein
VDSARLAFASLSEQTFQRYIGFCQFALDEVPVLL